MDEPMLRAYVHDSVRPQPTYATRAGPLVRRHRLAAALGDAPGAGT